MIEFFYRHLKKVVYKKLGNYMEMIYLSFLITLSLTGRWSRCALPLRCATRHGAQGSGGHLIVGFASPLSRLRFTHGYTLTAAYVASLLPRLRSCCRCRGSSLLVKSNRQLKYIIPFCCAQDWRSFLWCKPSTDYAPFRALASGYAWSRNYVRCRFAASANYFLGEQSIAEKCGFFPFFTGKGCNLAYIQKNILIHPYVFLGRRTQ